MATLPDFTALGQRPQAPGPSGVASYEPPNWRTVGLAGQEMQRAGGDLQQTSQILDAAQQKQDQIGAVNAANQLKQATLSLEQDPQNGFLNTKGNAVVGPQFVKDYQEKLKQAQDQIADGLQNDNQRQMFQQHSQVIGLQFQSSLLQHQAKETTLFNQQTRANQVDINMNDIAAHPYDEMTFQTNMLSIGKAIVDTGKDMGLSGDALANYVKDKTLSAESKALAYRTSSMMLDNPILAADFFHKHELNFDPQDRLKLGQELKSATDAQTSRIIGQQAYQSAIGQPQASPLPTNKGADFVKPFNQQQIDNVKTLVDKPSQYDSLFQKYAAQYNISPTELKMRAAVESGLNSNATSPAGAQGLMQLTADTAKALGVTDRNDPEQSIAGAAKLIASQGGTLGGDMSKVDRAYYGGNVNAKGPNTDQYVENMRAVRDQLMGTSKAPLTEESLKGAEGRVISNAIAYAEAHRPGDMVYRDMTITEAQNNYTRQLRAIEGQNYQNYSALLSSSIGPAGARSVSDLSPQQQQMFADLPPEKQVGLMNHWIQSSRQDDKPVKENEDNTNQYLAIIGQSITDPVAFKNRNIAADVAGLPEKFRTAILAQYTNIDKNMAKGAQYDKVLQDPQIKAMLDTAHVRIPSSKTAAGDTKDYQIFAGALRDRMDDFMNQNQKSPTQKESVQMVGQLLANFKVQAWPWDKTVPGFKLEANSQSDTSEAKVTPVIPTAEKNQITSGFQSRYGRAPSQSEMNDLYIINRLHPNDAGRLHVFDQTVRQNSAAMIKGQK